MNTPEQIPMSVDEAIAALDAMLTDKTIIDIVSDEIECAKYYALLDIIKDLPKDVVTKYVLIEDEA